MSNYEFGIGISVDGADDAAKAIGGVITDIERLQNSMTSTADLGLEQIFKGVDLSLLAPANDQLEDAATTLREIKAILVGLSTAAGLTTEAIADAAVPIAEVDQGLVEVAARACGVSTSLEEVDEGLREVASTTGMWGAAISGVSGALDRVSDSASEIRRISANLGAMGSKLEFVSVNLEASLGKGRKAAVDFGAGVLATANRTKVAWESVLALQSGLRAVSVDFDMGTAAGRRQMDTMVMLTEAYGMSQAEVADLAGVMKATGNSLETFAGIGASFQAQFKVPGLLNQVPVAAQAAMDAQASFGTLVGKSSKDITTNILRMTGVYAKSLGVNASEAARKALGTFQKFTAEIESYEDLFLGLADDFTPLQTAFLETGMGLEDMQDLMRKGQNDPAAYADAIRQIRDTMDPQMGERFFRQVLRNSDEATRALLTQEAAAKEANKATSGAGVEPEDPSATFNKIANSMRESALSALEQENALKGVAVEMGKLAASEGIRKGVQVVNGVLQSTNDILLGQVRALTDTNAAMGVVGVTVAGLTATFEGLNLSLDTSAAILGGSRTTFLAVSSIFGAVLRPISALVKYLGALRGASAAAAGGSTGAAAAGSKLGSIFGGVGKIIGKLALPIGIAVAAFDNIVEAAHRIGDVLSDPSKTGMDKFKGVVGAVIGAVAGTIDDFFLGLPGAFINGFTNIGKVIDTTGSESWGQAIGRVLGNAATAFTNFFFNDLPSMVKSAGKSISEAWQSLSFYDDIFLPIVSGFAAVGDHIIAFFKGVGVGVMEAFGIPAAQVGPVFELEFLKAQKAIYAFIAGVSDSFMDLVSTIKEMFNLGGFFDALWSGIATSANVAISNVMSGLIGKIVSLAKENPTIAGWLGFGEETVGGLEQMQRDLSSAAAAAEAQHSATLRRIDEERASRSKQIWDEQREREAATAATSKILDDQMIAKRRQLDELAMRGATGNLGVSVTSPTVVAAAPPVPQTALPTITPGPTISAPVLPLASAGQVAAGAGSPVIAGVAGGGGGGGGGNASPQEIKNVITLTVQGGDNLFNMLNWHMSSQSETGSGLGR